jgi:hypothetical protein
MYPDHFLDGNLLENRLEVWRWRLGQPASNHFVGVVAADSGIAGFICAYGGHDREWSSFIDNLISPLSSRGKASSLSL